MSTTVAAVRPPAALTAARCLFGVAGAVKLAGATYFSFVASAAQGGDPEGWIDWSVVVWSFSLALAFLALAAGLRPGRRTLVRGAVLLLLAEVAFSLVKLTVYDEPEAVVFMAVDALLLGLLALSRRSRAA